MTKLFALLIMMALSGALQAQAPEGTLSQGEIDSLRDAAYVPMDRVKEYEKILDTRQRSLDALVAKRHSTDFAADVHDVIDQMGGIADELNDNLDSYREKHRDLRKVLPKLVEATERWSTALRAPAKDERYEIVRKVALDALKDTRELAVEMEGEQAAYFREHPEAAKVERERVESPHAVR